ncbi:MAG: ATP-binding protein, partial [Gemmataceae bacterium]|nr:ATP-binding protein [Gemmataceae bacterium]
MTDPPRPPRIHHCTSEPYRFFGRGAELDLLDRALGGEGPSVVALVGPGGQGKTAIVQHWLQHLLGHGLETMPQQGQHLLGHGLQTMPQQGPPLLGHGLETVPQQSPSRAAATVSMSVPCTGTPSPCASQARYFVFGAPGGKPRTA